MSLHIFVDPLQGAVFLICILTIPICTAATVLRFTNTRRSGRKVNLEDWFALVALLSFWLHAALSLWTILILNGKDRFKAGALEPDELVRMSKVGYVMQLNFPVNPTFAKLSLLALYYRIFKIRREFVRWMLLLVILQICWFLAIFLTRVMFCIPLSNLWTANFPKGCIDASLLLAAGEAVNAAIAFAMVALAMFMVRTLAMSNSTKWKLRFLFVLGGLTGVIDIVSIIEAYGTITLNLTYLCLVTIQMMANSICCCAPVYRTIIPEIPILRKLRSKISSIHSSVSRSEKAPKTGSPPNITIVTIGGTTRKRACNEQEWIQVDTERSGSPDGPWSGAQYSTDVESGSIPLHEMEAQIQGNEEDSQVVRVHRTYEVAGQ